MNLREKIEDEIRVEMAWLERARKEILQEEELTEESKKYLSLAMAPWKNSGTRMNLVEYKKAIRLREILFGSRQKKKMPGWIFEFSGEKIGRIERRIAERFRADLGKKLMRELKKIDALVENWCGG